MMKNQFIHADQMAIQFLLAHQVACPAPAVPDRVRRSE
jgi:hypothetical protein